MNLNNPFKIEKIVNEILESENIITPPVNVMEIADFKYDLTFEEDNLDKYSIAGDVLAAINIDEKVIKFNSSKKYELNLNFGRKNFTIAHELGHFIMHRNLAKSLTVLNGQSKFIFCREIGSSVRGIERQADLFAVYLLMPEKMILEYYNKINESFTEKHLRQMADVFGVSKEAMKLRLWKELKLLYVDKRGNYYGSQSEFQEINGQQKLF